MKKAFTLAEVLITLGIIGVVAVITIPNLMTNINAHKYRNQFKKTVSTLSQAARMSEARYDFDFAGISQKCGSNAKTEHPESTHTVCALLNGTLSGVTYNNVKDLKTTKNKQQVLYTSTITQGDFITRASYMLNNSHAYSLSDGTLVVINGKMGEFPCDRQIGSTVLDVNPTGVGLSECFGFIDVNGTALPNKEVSCSSGSNSLAENTCIVKNNNKNMTDIFPIRLHNGVVTPGTAAARYILNSSK